MAKNEEIKRKDIQTIASEYDKENITIGIFGSDSALPTGYAAKKAGLPTMLITKKGRDKTYSKHNSSLYDNILTLDDWSEMLAF